MSRSWQLAFLSALAITLFGVLTLFSRPVSAQYPASNQVYRIPPVGATVTLTATGTVVITATSTAVLPTVTSVPATSTGIPATSTRVVTGTTTTIPATSTRVVTGTATTIPATSTRVVTGTATSVAATSTSTSIAATATRVPATSTPTPGETCVPGTPTRVATPVFTPAAGCNDQPHPNDLRGDITVLGTTSNAVFTNRSTTCSYRVGVAVYKRFDNNIDHQELYDYQVAIIPPNSLLTLTVNNPPCSYQVDAFWGDVLYSLNGQRYGARLLQDEVHYNGGYCQLHCNVQPTSTPGTTGTPAATLTPGTPTATPISGCTVPFTDVDPSNPFYATIRCLACRGIISGYADGAFHWGASVTRGQLAKIVSQAAGYTDAIAPTQQTFSDVPATYTFWLSIERAARHGLISGYTDGTYRPGNAVTRAQLAKIAANAARYQDTVTTQTFSDVPPSHPFYLYIERMARHGTLSGYADGSFRPANEVTRGQTAKIVSATFFPTCH